MSRVEAVYKTTDGEFFDSLEKAEEHQKKVDLWFKIAEKFGIYGTLEINYLSDFLEIIQFYEDNK